MSFRIDIEINEEILRSVMTELKIEHKPPTITTNHQDVKSLMKKTGFVREEWGHYLIAENHIALQSLPPSYARLHLFHLQPHVREVLLHELRHAHQYECWPKERLSRAFDGPYWLQDGEKDARKWSYAANQRDDFRGLVKVTRQALGEPVKLP